MNNTVTLSQHLANLNAEKLAWMAEGPDRWTGLWVEDEAYWNSMGVFTVEDFERHDLISLIWDMYKDVTGCRPRHMDFDSMSLADLRQEADYLGAQMERAIKADEEWERLEEEYRREEEAEFAAWLEEQPEPIDYVACNYQEGWL